MGHASGCGAPFQLPTGPFSAEKQGFPGVFLANIGEAGGGDITLCYPKSYEVAGGRLRPNRIHCTGPEGGVPGLGIRSSLRSKYGGPSGQKNRISGLELDSDRIYMYTANKLATSC